MMYMVEFESFEWDGTMVVAQGQDNMISAIQVVGPYTYSMYIDQTDGVTIGKVIYELEITTEDGNYVLSFEDTSEDNTGRTAKFYNDTGSGKEPIGSETDAVSDDNGGYYWEFTAEDGTTYKVTITGVKWGTNVAEDDYTEAEITVTVTPAAAE